MKPLVSILIPAYNAEKFIGQTLFSAVHQTYPHTEIIVVDDGSTDRTAEVVSQFDGVRLVRQKNSGAAAARNRGFAESTGDYIQWLDADDILHPQKIEHQMYCVNGDSRILYSCPWGKFKTGNHNDAEFRPTPLWADLSPLDFLILKMSSNTYIQTNCWLVSRELSLAAGPWDSSILSDDDGEYFCRVIMQSKAVKFVPDSKVYYRHSGPSGLSSIGTSPKKIASTWTTLNLYVERVLSMEDSDRTRDACAKLFSDWMPCFYPEHMEQVREADRICRSLGRTLVIPEPTGKYGIIKSLLGWNAAKFAMRNLPMWRWKLINSAAKVINGLRFRSESS